MSTQLAWEKTHWTHRLIDQLPSEWEMLGKEIRASTPIIVQSKTHDCVYTASRDDMECNRRVPRHMRNNVSPCGFPWRLRSSLQSGDEHG